LPKVAVDGRIHFAPDGKPRAFGSGVGNSPEHAPAKFSFQREVPGLQVRICHVLLIEESGVGQNEAEVARRIQRRREGIHHACIGIPETVLHVPVNHHGGGERRLIRL